MRKNNQKVEMKQQDITQVIRQELALTYRIIALLGWDDATYNHLTHRHPNKDHFFIQPFGLLFEEVTASDLVEVSFSGQAIGSQSPYVNPTGYAIHSAIYQARPDIHAIFHLHTPASIAVSVEAQGILPISQHAYHFYNRVGYFDYDSLTLHQSTQGTELAAHILKDHPILMLRNHGTLVCGRTIQEAFFYQYHLEKACQIQCLVQDKENLIMPAKEICEKAQRDILSTEETLGARDWASFVRKLERLNKLPD